ncbi:HAD family hydrolase [Paenalkalicoccus suaedae]|uniref:Phosphoserine phosphatase n=1 Tax=Paenalkalicoccus suaedae TaxID=2592382 RepID=A0A859FH37_9BACI|nr:HAD family hydrolase [Paenalkalicoccus suaedae]QKS72138.1 HAD family hydrolase [Paenalkalicoccus suaedae]
MSKKALFFDLDDTLLWDEKSIQTALELTCQSVDNVDAKVLEDEVRKAARSHYSGYDVYSFTQMIGINPFEGLWGSFNDEGEKFQELHSIIEDYQFKTWQTALERVGITDDQLALELKDQFIQQRINSPFLFDDALPILKELSQSYTLLMLTNGAPSLQNLKLKLTPELVPYFDHIIISGDFGKGKPDVSIFVHALEVANVKKEDVLMIGDNPQTDILGANRAGIDSVWLNRFDKPTPPVQATHEIKELNDLHKLL